MNSLRVRPIVHAFAGFRPSFARITTNGSRFFDGLFVWVKFKKNTLRIASVAEFHFQLFFFSLSFRIVDFPFVFMEAV